MTTELILCIIILIALGVNTTLNIFAILKMEEIIDETHNNTR